MQTISKILIASLGLAAAATGAGKPAPSSTFETTIDIERKASLAEQCANGVVDQTDLKANLDVCNAALAQSPSDANTYFYRGFNHFYLEDYAAAEADFTQAIDLGTSYLAKAYYQRGVCKEKGRRLKEASLDFKKAHQLSPDWSQARRKVEEYAWAYK